MQFIYQLSDIQIILLFVLATLLYTATLYSILLLTLSRFQIPMDNFFGITIIGTLVSLSAVLLVFTLIQSISLSQRIEAHVKTEVALIETLDETLTLFSDQKAREARQKLILYITSVINEEWPKMKQGEESLATEKLFDTILPTTAEITTNKKSEEEVYEHAISICYDLAKSRHMRLVYSGTKLSDHFWLGITFLFTLNILQFFLLARRNYYSLVILSLHMSALGLLLGLIFIHDQPFEATNRDLLEPYSNALEDLATR